MNWNCTDTEERLSDFLEGTLSREEAAAFSAHMAECGPCAELVAQVGGLVHQMHSTEPLEAPSRLVTNILDATIGPRKARQGWQRWFAWVPAILEPRFAMGALTVAASCAIVMHAAGLTPSAITTADLNPANVARSANRQAHLTYARTLKFVDDLQLVYEIRTQLEPENQTQGTPTTEPFAEPAPESTPESSPDASPNRNSQPQQQTPAPPQQKSETNPPSGTERSHRVSSNGSLLAFSVVNGWTSFGEPRSNR